MFLLRIKLSTLSNNICVGMVQRITNLAKDSLGTLGRRPGRIVLAAVEYVARSFRSSRERVSECLVQLP